MHYVQFGSNISPDYVMPPILIDNVKTYRGKVGNFDHFSHWRLVYPRTIIPPYNIRLYVLRIFSYLVSWRRLWNIYENTAPGP